MTSFSNQFASYITPAPDRPRLRLKAMFQPEPALGDRRAQQ